ncbi:MAG TPA: STAS domain-containing protein [Candidatus Eremiobacteraceae bacterium]|nr:STAS domain-containing protein [Candidatus Eremiobacteraceae bacterium]
MILQTLPDASGWRLFKVEGQLDFAAAPTIGAALMHAADIEHGDLLIDLEDIKTADEKGVGTLKLAVRRLLNDHPGVHIAIVAKHGWLADELAKADYPEPIAVYRDGSEALDSIHIRRAA